uniref:Uncharacterized protein n=1 Tax=Cucumis melo TaxID=3656 RepID=A0A9I9ELT1_CUCME
MLFGLSIGNKTDTSLCHWSLVGRFQYIAFDYAMLYVSCSREIGPVLDDCIYCSTLWKCEKVCWC